MTPEEEAEIARMEAILADPNHPEWFETWCYVTEIGYGPPVEHGGDVQHAPATRAVRRRAPSRRARRN